MAAETRSRVRGRTTSVPLGTDLGLLVVRLIVGGLFVGHGTGKLFGWFGQGGIDGTGAFFESVGYKPGEELAIVAGIVELAAGAMLMLGFMIPLAAAIIIGDMMNAAWVKSSAGFWVADDGYEYEFVLIFLVLALTITGAGAYALDRNREWFRSRAGGVAVAVVLGVISGIVMLVIRD
ncbi:MAG TPA: DoxX family protein [Streptosporangiaceae bacterium]|nr:DoxX family protein [Streptosporangiaceae bacterium]